MPGTYTYPGVYVEEVPSGVRPIAGVSTSDTAFVGNFSRGPLNKAVRLTSFADFERQFGGLRRDSEASYAIYQYYRNGGSIAWVVRVAGGTPKASSFAVKKASATAFTATAASEGLWGNNVQVGVGNADSTAKTFDLVLREVVKTRSGEQVGRSEVHLNLSIVRDDPRFAEKVVSASALAGVGFPSGVTKLPDNTGSDVTTPQAIGDPKSTSFKSLANGDDGSLPGKTQVIGSESAKSGMHALADIAPFVFNILCLPDVARIGEGSDASYKAAVTDAEAFCEAHRAFFLADPRKKDATPAQMTTLATGANLPRHRNAAVYYPRVQISDPLDEGRLRDVGPGGTLAGCCARTDASRGVWKAPAGTDVSLRGASVVRNLNDLENGGLNQLGVNVLRTFPIYGAVSWGGRTLDGADQQASEWKYIPVRRTALFIEESLAQGLKWVVFEPNDEPLWSQIRLNVGAFMQNLFRKGAFQGSAPKDAYFVRCDASTTTQADIDLGIVYIDVGFAPLKPAEFVVIRIQQKTQESQA